MHGLNPYRNMHIFVFTYAIKNNFAKAPEVYIFMPLMGKLVLRNHY